MLQLAEGYKCQIHVINYLNLLLFVTSHAKTYTIGFVLNGQKPTAIQRVPNGFSNVFNGFLDAFNGCAKTFNGL